MRHVDRIGLLLPGGDVDDLALERGIAHRNRIDAIRHRTGAKSNRTACSGRCFITKGQRLESRGCGQIAQGNGIIRVSRRRRSIPYCNRCPARSRALVAYGNGALIFCQGIIAYGNGIFVGSRELTYRHGGSSANSSGSAVADGGVGGLDIGRNHATPLVFDFQRFDRHTDYSQYHGCAHAHGTDSSGNRGSNGFLCPALAVGRGEFAGDDPGSASGAPNKTVSLVHLVFSVGLLAHENEERIRRVRSAGVARSCEFLEKTGGAGKDAGCCLLPVANWRMGRALPRLRLQPFRFQWRQI
ncbi:hypothetical protein D3C78_779540 [compost metagenome]